MLSTRGSPSGLAAHSTAAAATRAAVSQWYSLRLAPLHRHRDAGDAVAGAGERGAHGARVQHEVPGVGAGVDARRDEVGEVAERAEAGGEHRGRGRRVDGVHRQVGELVPDAAFDRRGTGAVQPPDRGAGAAAVVGGRDHQHVVTVGDERSREGMDTRASRRRRRWSRGSACASEPTGGRRSVNDG